MPSRYELKKIDKRKAVDFFLAAACFFVGSAIYMLFRPTTLLMFHWADLFGLTELIFSVRKHVTHASNGLMDWFVYSLPFSLWMLSCLFFVSGIWRKSTSKGRFLWFWSIPMLSVIAELAQSLFLIPGHFDPGDLVAIIFATILGIVATETKFSPINKEITTS